MTTIHDERWNHMLLLVPHDRFRTVEACLDDVMPWTKVMRSDVSAAFAFNAPRPEEADGSDAETMTSVVTGAPQFLGNRRAISMSMARGTLYLRGSDLADQLLSALDSARHEHAELDAALVALQGDPSQPEATPHIGFMVESHDEWERRLAGFERAAEEHPEWEIEVRAVNRPTDPQALTPYLYQAWVRIGLLGPLQNTFEMQCLNPELVEV